MPARNTIPLGRCHLSHGFSKRITHQDMLAFVAGRADDETKRRIAEELRSPTSYARMWMERLEAGTGNPLEVDWAQLVDPAEREDPSRRPESRDDARRRLSRLQREFLKLYEQGETERAEEIAKYAAGLAIEHLGPDDPDTAMTLTDIGCLLQKEGKHDVAKEYHEQALEINQRFSSKRQVAAARNMCNLGSAYHCTGEHREARRYYEQALAIWERHLGRDDANVARGLNNLGCLLYSMEEHQEAEEHLQRGLRISEERLGSEHVDVAVVRNNLSVVHKVLGRMKHAKGEEEAALIVLRRHVPKDHPFFIADAKTVVVRSPEGQEMILLTRAAA